MDSSGALPGNYTGWWPSNPDAPKFQNYFKNGHTVGLIVSQQLKGQKWVPYDLTKLNPTQTGALQIASVFDTREEAQTFVEHYFQR